jgi:hypothetical protein
MQSQHVLEKTEKLTTSIFRQNGQPFLPIVTDERKRLEALAIKTYNPLLNKQVDRKAVSFI